MRLMTGKAISSDTIPKSYAPSDIEAEIIDRWEAANIGHCTADTNGTPFTILIPPPNVTAPLHLGHALNNTLQDVLIRWHRMKGDASLWMPGTDHAGIATQTVVEKRLMQQESKKRTDFTREEFVSRVQSWKEEYEGTILSQLRKLGASCDWDRTRFTMDDVCTTAVREAFFRLYKDELIYRGKRLVNWDPVTLTALADDEVEMKEVAGHMYYLQYPLEDGSGTVTVATTRPETMLGDTAVAINPSDPRAEALKGKSIRLPIVGRIIPIVEDDYVVMAGDSDDPKAAFATGFLKVTPAHDPNDWDIGTRHDLDVINVMSTSATISDKNGWDDVSDEAKQFLDMSREDARTAIIEWFKTNDLFEGMKDYEHSVGHSYRSHVPIEPYLSDQWYVKVTDDRLCNEALRSLSTDQYDGSPPQRHSGQRIGDGELKFFPERYARSFQTWHENLRDWCISRQLWWGHQIPVWVKSFPLSNTPEFPHQEDAAVSFQLEEDEGEGLVNVYVCVQGNHHDIEHDLEADGFIRDEDVLDTWFSSALWPISTMGWPNPSAFPETEGLLEKYNPSSVICTGRDIITLWVSRMVMFNRYFRDGIMPFTDVFIHPMIQDGFGQRMSKSLGNGVDPRDIITTHGADAMRFSLVQLSTGTQDVRLSVDVICPYTSKVFVPTYVKSKTGHEVMSPIQSSPDNPDQKMSTLYGLLIGAAEDCEETPLAMNSSSRFDIGRNFANKFWNSARFALMNIDAPAPSVLTSELQAVDHWMLSRVQNAITRMNDALTTYQFNVIADSMYDLLWRDFCDWYLEAIKPTIKSSPAQQRILLTIVDIISRLLHPICPFVTEAIWPHIQAYPEGKVEGCELLKSDLVANAKWPEVSSIELDSFEIDAFEKLRTLVTAIRGARASAKVKPKRKIEMYAPKELCEFAATHQLVVSSLAGLDKISESQVDQTGMAVVVDCETIYLENMLDAKDVKADNERVSKEIEMLEQKIAGFQGRLNNESYISNAPESVVQETRDMLAKTQMELQTVKESIGK